jgi:hypothetical protein
VTLAQGTPLTGRAPTSKPPRPCQSKPNLAGELAAHARADPRCSPSRCWQRRPESAATLGRDAEAQIYFHFSLSNPRVRQLVPSRVRAGAAGSRTVRAAAHLHRTHAGARVLPAVALAARRASHGLCLATAGEKQTIAADRLRAARSAAPRERSARLACLSLVIRFCGGAIVEGLTIPVRVRRLALAAATARTRALASVRVGRLRRIAVLATGVACVAACGAVA